MRVYSRLLIVSALLLGNCVAYAPLRLQLQRPVTASGGVLVCSNKVALLEILSAHQLSAGIPAASELSQYFKSTGSMAGADCATMLSPPMFLLRTLGSFEIKTPVGVIQFDVVEAFLPGFPKPVYARIPSQGL